MLIDRRSLHLRILHPEGEDRLHLPIGSSVLVLLLHYLLIRKVHTGYLSVQPRQGQDTLNNDLSSCRKEVEPED